VKTTLLAAHTLPPEFAARADEYIDTIATEWLPALHDEGLVDAVDVFCEHIAFDVPRAERLFHAAQRLGLPVKMHSEQLTNIGGAQLGARSGALSCDHLEFATAADAAALARAGTVGVLLPIAYYSLGAARKPPVSELRAAGVPLAVATDANPGSAPGSSLLLAMSMATRLFGLTTEEALRGVTCNAARALGDPQAGVLATDRYADFAVWNIESLEELGYWAGYNPCRMVVHRGRAQIVAHQGRVQEAR
jgi:imidazolonepropionase